MEFCHPTGCAARAAKFVAAEHVQRRVQVQVLFRPLLVEVPGQLQQHLGGADAVAAVLPRCCSAISVCTLG